MLEASRVTINNKTFDLNHLKGKKKTNLRRKVIIEYIESKPAGEIIRMHQFQKAGHFATPANATEFVNRMIRDGVINKYEGERPKSHYYAVTGAVRVKQPRDDTHHFPPLGLPKIEPVIPTQLNNSPDMNTFIADMQKLGVEFTITISNKTGA